MRAPSLLLSLSLLALPLMAQARERVLEGFAARASRGGIGLPAPAALRDTSVAFYPGVRFYSGELPLEHGGTLRLYGAVDSAGQLYLLDSPASFRLLHARHFRGTLDSVAAGEIALLAARFGGQLPDSFTVRERAILPMRAAGRGDERRLIGWEVHLTVRSTLGTDRLHYWIMLPTGTPELMSRECEDWCKTTIIEP